jgi:hypothetical protein
VKSALHSASSDLLNAGADRPFAGMASDKMRRPGTQRTLKRQGSKNVARSLHALREPQQSTRLGSSHDNAFSRSKDGTYLMRLSALGVLSVRQPLLRRLS